MHRPKSRLCFLLLCSLLPLDVGFLDDSATAVAQELALPKIADEPKLVDPATVMPPVLAVQATVDFSDSSLQEIIAWLQSEHQLVVLPDERALSDFDIELGDPLSDRLDDAPIYLLLNRLRALDIGWYYEDDILHVTSLEAIQQRLTSTPYNLGDLLDAKFESDDLADVITTTISPDSWEELGGRGGLSFVGDVMFVRQTDAVHREVSGILSALRNFGRRTFTLDPPQHLLLRQKLEEKISVDFQNTPLDDVAKRLAKHLEIDIRIDLPALNATRIRVRQPVTLRLENRKTRTVLGAMIDRFELTWNLRDGVLWITTKDEAEVFSKTAVYDVRDLCRDDSESEALRDAIVSQTPDDWEDFGGPATARFAKAGVMVVNGQENLLMEVLELLETYRAALRNSKPRDLQSDETEKTVYYRLHTNVAEDLAELLPKLVRPDSWKNQASPDAMGEIIRVASPDEVFDKQAGPSRVEQRSVLIIRQSRAAHDAIREVIRRIEAGDPMYSETSAGVGGMGGGGGGFGGGFFRVPDRVRLGQ